jgi:hypothetical protein
MAGVTFVSVAHLYLFRNVLTETGIWDMFGKILPAIIETDDLDAVAEVVIEEQFEPELRPLRDKFVPLAAFIESKAPKLPNNQVGAQ